jgi:hypothetical protein
VWLAASGLRLQGAKFVHELDESVEMLDVAATVEEHAPLIRRDGRLDQRSSQGDRSSAPLLIRTIGNVRSNQVRIAQKSVLLSRGALG